MTTAFPSVRTEDGTVIVRCPKTGLAVSGLTQAGATAELRRLIAARRVS
ncbi:hypothetical protein [Pseudaminobacter soli (ex Li et al. 2025)]|nr:hypothetical protein [Mesorhizobium soli]